MKKLDASKWGWRFMLTKSSALLALLLDQGCQSKSEIFAEWSAGNEQCWQDQAWGDEGTWTSSLKQEPRAWAEPHGSNCSALLLSSSILLLLPARLGGFHQPGCAMPAQELLSSCLDECGMLCVAKGTPALVCSKTKCSPIVCFVFQWN